jgi:type III secretion protein J
VRTVAVLLVVVVGCSTEIAGGLDERDAREVMAALHEAGIGADLEAERGHYALRVSAGEAGRAAAVMVSRGLPRAAKPGFERLYDTAGMLPTPAEERARFLEAVAGEIAALLQHLSGVVDADVVVTSGRASVLLRVAPGATVSVEDVKRLVAGAVEGLAEAQVTVVTTPAAAMPAAGQGLARLGPFHVAPSSRAPLLGVLAGALLAIMALAAWIFLRERRLRRVRT